jgi:hypothetical protein
MKKQKDVPYDSDASIVELPSEPIPIFAPAHDKRLVCLGPLDPRPNDSEHTARSSAIKP